MQVHLGSLAGAAHVHSQQGTTGAWIPLAPVEGQCAAALWLVASDANTVSVSGPSTGLLLAGALLLRNTTVPTGSLLAMSHLAWLQAVAYVTRVGTYPEAEVSIGLHGKS